MSQSKFLTNLQRINMFETGMELAFYFEINRIAHHRNLLSRHARLLQTLTPTLAVVRPVDIVAAVAIPRRGVAHRLEA